MANGTSDATTPAAPDPSIPDLGGQTVDQLLGPRPGPAPGTQAQGPGWAARYAQAASTGTAAVAPIAAAEAFVPAVGPEAAMGTLALGAIGGVAHQAAQEWFPNTPWAPAAADIGTGLASGGLGLVRQAGSAIARNLPAAGAMGAVGLLAVDHLADRILETAGSHMAQMTPEMIAATTLIAPATVGALRILARPGSWDAWRGPVATTVGGLGQSAFQWGQQQVEQAYQPHQYNP